MSSQSPFLIFLSNLQTDCTGAIDATKASWGCPPALPTHLDKISRRRSVPFPLNETVCTPPAKGGKPLLLPVYPSIAPCAALLQIR